MGCSAGKEMEQEEDGRVSGDHKTSQSPKLDESINKDPSQTQISRPKSGKSISSLSSSKSIGKVSSFAKRALKEHNNYREIHKAEPLVLNPTLCEMAEKLCRHLAETRMFANSNPESRQHRGEECGESLYRHWGGKDDRVKAETVSRSWYDEVDNYHHDMAGFDLATCHFTQMVWKQTQEMGIAQAHYDDDDGFRKFVVVANYFPSGNIEGDYELNVCIPEGFFDNPPDDAVNAL